MQKCNACLIYDEIEKSRNHLVLADDRVYKLLGISDDDKDWYYMFEDLRGVMIYWSCVMGFIDLFDLLQIRDYKNLYRLFQLNKKPQKKKKMKDMSKKLPEKCYCKKKRAKK